MPQDVRHTIEWIDHGREPQNPPDPDYPKGIDLDVSNGASVTCTVQLPYPAERCGHWYIECVTCGMIVGCTTAGRIDDPRSIKIACRGH